MPYIVTTRRYLSSPEDLSTTEYVERRAVATLDEAREEVETTIDRAYVGREYGTRGSALWASVGALPESGGTGGRLPDGTLIEVERVTWMHLGMHTAHPGWTGQLPDDQILDAFNATQGVEA